MRRLLSIVIFLSLLATYAGAQAPVHPYVGLFVDENRGGWCATGTPVYAVEWWLWVLPGENGFASIAFNMPMPPDISHGDGVRNPSLMFHSIKCSPPCPDYMFPITTCLYEWTWIYHETIYVGSSDPVVVRILNFPDNSELITVENCVSDEEPAVRFTDLYINYPLDSPECTGTSVECRSWGAIKSLIDH